MFEILPNEDCYKSFRKAGSQRSKHDSLRDLCGHLSQELVECKHYVRQLLVDKSRKMPDICDCDNESYYTTCGARQ